MQGQECLIKVNYNSLFRGTGMQKKKRANAMPTLQSRMEVIEKNSNINIEIRVWSYYQMFLMGFLNFQCRFVVRPVWNSIGYLLGYQQHFTTEKNCQNAC